MNDNADKRLALEAFLQQGVVLVLLDARQPGVSVPENLRNEHLLLNFSQRFADGPPSVDAWGVRQVLTFSGARFSIQVPWEAVIAMTAKNGEIAAWLPPTEPPPITKRRGILGLVN